MGLGELRAAMEGHGAAWSAVLAGTIRTRTPVLERHRDDGSETPRSGQHPPGAGAAPRDGPSDYLHRPHDAGRRTAVHRRWGLRRARRAGCHRPSPPSRRRAECLDPGKARGPAVRYTRRRRHREAASATRRRSHRRAASPRDDGEPGMRVHVSGRVVGVATLGLSMVLVVGACSGGWAPQGVDTPPSTAPTSGRHRRPRRLRPSPPRRRGPPSPPARRPPPSPAPARARPPLAPRPSMAQRPSRAGAGFPVAWTADNTHRLRDDRARGRGRVDRRVLLLHVGRQPRHPGRADGSRPVRPVVRVGERQRDPRARRDRGHALRGRVRRARQHRRRHRGFQVGWKGPNGPQDYVTIVKKGSKAVDQRELLLYERRQPRQARLRR